MILLAQLGRVVVYTVGVPAQQVAFVHLTGFVTCELSRRDYEELRRHEIELGGKCKEARVQGGLGLSLFKGLAVVKVGVREDAP